MLADLPLILTWWAVLFALGLIFLPLTRKIFHRFFDQGYLFTKVLGIAVSSYLVWLLGSLKLLPFTQSTIWLVLVFGLIVNLILVIKNRSLVTGSQSLFFTWLGEELIFLITLAAWSFVRGFQPNIQGLEKFMDFGFVNSILRSDFFPPADMWFAGSPINYYYFGHFVTAFLTKLTKIDSAVTYNLMIATLFASTFSLTFSLTGNLIYFFLKQKLENSRFTKIIVGGLVSALIISLGANLHPAYYGFKMNILKRPYCDGSVSYWYPNATRYIGYCPEVDDKTIHEFPSYSFIVSDLHGHVSDIPFVLLFLALVFNLFLYLKESKKTVLTFDFCALSLTTSLTLAVMFMTNQWDFPIYLMVLGFLLLAGSSRHFGLSTAILRTVIYGGVVLVLALLFALPFLLNFDPIVNGIAWTRAHSLPHQLLILWGAFWFFGLSFLLFLLAKNIKLKVRADILVLILFLVGTILIIIPEIVYVKDIYIPSYHRANTMFKLTYQSFILYSLAAGYIFSRLIFSLKPGFGKKLFGLFSTLLIGLVLLYPNYSLKGYYGNLNRLNYQGLYGLAFLKKFSSADYQLVVWLNQNIKGQPVVLEAVGDSYTDYGRISMASGLPTVQGWLVHEWLWRGGFDEPSRRAAEVQSVYESSDPEQTKRLLEKYQVKYVVVGELEKNKYPNIAKDKFLKLGKEVFRSEQTSLFKIEN